MRLRILITPLEWDLVPGFETTWDWPDDCGPAMVRTFVRIKFLCLTLEWHRT